MHIIAGKFRRRSLVFPKDRSFRPTKSIVRESVFNMIGEDIQDANFLDLCSGSGAIGLEAESRGAGSVICVDRFVKYVRENKAALGASIHVIRSDILRYLKRTSDAFNFIFFDPIWSDHNAYIDGVTCILDRHLLLPNGRLILEHDRSFDAVGYFSLNVDKHVQYGNSYITVLRPE